MRSHCIPSCAFRGGAARLRGASGDPSRSSGGGCGRNPACDFVSFIAYCLLVTLKNTARRRVGGLTPRAIIEAFGTIQMVDVHLPTTDGRHLVLSRYTKPRKEQELLLHQLGMPLPTQSAPRISS